MGCVAVYLGGGVVHFLKRLISSVHIIAHQLTCVVVESPPDIMHLDQISVSEL